MNSTLTLIPVGGLANRMKAIDAAVALARDTGAELHVLWFKDRGLNCRFDELFAPLALPGVTLKEASFLDLWLYDRPRKKNFRIPRLFQKLRFDDCIYEERATRLFYDAFDFRTWVGRGRRLYLASCVYFYPQPSTHLFKIFRPLPALQARIDKAELGSHAIGIHIRRTDNIASIRQSPTELFVQRMRQEIAADDAVRFYLASDSEEDKALLKREFGERIITSPRKADRNSVAGMQDALVELYTLSRTRRILGSMQSSYSETAAQISGIACELLKKTS